MNPNSSLTFADTKWFSFKAAKLGLLAECLVLMQCSIWELSRVWTESPSSPTHCGRKITN